MGLDFQKDLNREQYEVVKKGDGPVLVLAGAGSGKTRTLTYRVAYLIEQGVSPQNILLLTFTNKAAKEMLERVVNLSRGNVESLWSGTFHHVGNRILRRFAHLLDYKNNFSILDREDSAVLLKECYDGIVDKGRVSRYFPKPKIIFNLLSLARNRGGSLRSLMEESYDYLSGEELEIAENIAQEYDRRKRLANLMDFDDLLINWLILLKKNKEIKEKYQKDFQYILIDEYQDTNVIQDEIVEILAQKHKNILAVGDDAQSIYSFRAANINNILEFPQKFPGCRVYKLETNYRSRPEILHLANEAILNNTQKYFKKLKSIKEGGEKPVLAVLKNNVEQARWISEKIQEHVEQGVPPAEIAVLFRSAFQAMELELYLNREGIPYVMRGGIKFFEQKHIKDVLAYLRIVVNFKDELSWRRVLLLYPGIGVVGAQRIWEQIKQYPDWESCLENYTFPHNEKVRQSLENLFKTINNLYNLRNSPRIVKEAVDLILRQGYDVYLKTSFEDFRSRLEDLKQMGDLGSNYSSLADFLADVTLSQDFKGEEREEIGLAKNNRLVLSTIHQAKGLEWQVVFLIGLVEGQFPHRKVFDNPQEIEEERRLFYVGVTRAKDKLYLTFPLLNNQTHNINDLSTFVNELSPSLFEKVDLASADYDDLPIISYD